MSRAPLRFLVIPLFLLIAGAIPREPPAPDASVLIADMQVVYRLLTQTFYKPLPKETVLAGARRGITAYLESRGVRADIPGPSAKDSADPASYFTGIVNAGAAQARTSAKIIAYAGLHGMAQSARDRWTEYFDPDEFKAFDAPLDPPDVLGIGVLTAQDPKTKCSQTLFVIPGSPADRSGLQDGDLITSIDGSAACGINQDAVSKRLRGPEGSSVRVVIQRDGKTLDDAFTIERGRVQSPTVIFWMLPQSIGYVTVLAFGAPTPSEFSVALNRLESQGAKAIVLDLRDDGGGYVDSAVSVASHFIATGPIFTSISKGSVVTTESDDESPQVSVPLAVLVNQNTASASEIAASALEENQVGELIGTRTFGKGVEQTMTRLPDGSVIKITTARYVTASNHDLNGVGLEPDLSIPENASPQFGELDKDSQLRAAITYLKSKIPS